MNKFGNKVLAFAVGLQNAYKNEEDKEDVAKLEFKEEGLTEDFTAMLSALHVMYIKTTDENIDLIGFTHLLNRLAIQHLMTPKKGVTIDE